MSRFKVGDKVLVKHGLSDSSQKLANRVCTITVVENTYRYVKVEEESTLSGGGGGINFSEITLHKQKKKTIKKSDIKELLMQAYEQGLDSKPHQDPYATIEHTERVVEELLKKL